MTLVRACFCRPLSLVSARDKCLVAAAAAAVVAVVAAEAVASAWSLEMKWWRIQAGEERERQLICLVQVRSKSGCFLCSFGGCETCEGLPHY